MTREKAVGNLIHAIRWNDIPKKEVLEMAVEVLKQEPCEDAISREAALEALDCEINGNIESDIDLSKHKREFQEFANMILNAQEKAIQALPPVTPQQKTGHWINNQNGTFECDQCGCKHSKSRFCPDCGTKMVELQESEEE